MKCPLLVFAALGFLAQVTPAHGGGTRCGRTLPGHCRLYCHQKERTMFMCDRYKQCCILSDFLPVPVVSPFVTKSKASGTVGGPDRRSLTLQV
uniref:Beta-defensin n=1 Tax=Sciurus vulgaris TaxID=55149 RepID=A0A8D2APT2_SCIVU